MKTKIGIIVGVLVILVGGFVLLNNKGSFKGTFKPLSKQGAVIQKKDVMKSEKPQEKDAKKIPAPKAEMRGAAEAQPQAEVREGHVFVELAPETPASTFIGQRAEATFAKIKFTADYQQVSVDRLAVYASGSRDAIARVQLFLEEENRYLEPGDEPGYSFVSDDYQVHGVYSDSPSLFTLQPGETKTVSVRITLSTQAPVDATVVGGLYVGVNDNENTFSVRIQTANGSISTGEGAIMTGPGYAGDPNRLPPVIFRATRVDQNQRYPDVWDSLYILGNPMTVGETR